jgi:ArsR family transcriptional regulator
MDTDRRRMAMATRTELPLIEAAPALCCVPVGGAGLTDEEAAVTARLFKALADPHRVRIVNLLATTDEPVCGCDLEEPLGLAQATVSFHLKKLFDAGLLDREKRGVWVYHSLNREAAARLGDVLRFDARR